MSSYLWMKYNYPAETSDDPPNVQIEPSPSSSVVKENTQTLNLPQQPSNVETAVEKLQTPGAWTKHLEAERKCEELLDELASFDNPLNEETIKVAFKKVIGRARKMKRGKKIYKCPYCDYVCTPGGRDNMMHHLNGYSRYGYFFLPCRKRVRAKPAVNGVFEKLEPLDITGQMPENYDSGNCSSQK